MKEVESSILTLICRLQRYKNGYKLGIMKVNNMLRVRLTQAFYVPPIVKLRNWQTHYVRIVGREAHIG